MHTVADIKRVLATLKETLSPQASLPVLNGIRVEKDRLWTTDLNAFTEVAMESGIDDAVIPARPLMTLVGSLDPKTEVDFKVARVPSTRNVVKEGTGRWVYDELDDDLTTYQTVVKTTRNKRRYGRTMPSSEDLPEGSVRVQWLDGEPDAEAPGMVAVTDDFSVEKKGNLKRLVRRFINVEYEEVPGPEITQLIIESEGSSTTFGEGLAVADYPAFPELGDPTTTLTLDASFMDELAGVATAASDDNSRQVLTGVNFVITGKDIELSATDSYRLHISTFGADKRKGKQLALSALLQVDYLKALPKTTKVKSKNKDETPPTPITLDVFTEKRDTTTKKVKGKNKQVKSGSEVYVSYVRFTRDDVSVTMRPIEGQFPNYKQLIPVDAADDMIVDFDEADFDRKIKTFLKL